MQELRFKLDKSSFDELISNKTINTLAEKRLSDVQSDAYRRNLLGHSLRVTKRLAPDLFNCVARAQEKLGLCDKNIEVYIYSAPEANASCAYLGGDDIILTFSSGLLQSMDADEINFVVGHELGHALFSHYKLPCHGILEGSNLDANEAMKVMAWSRKAEISADRAGVYVCENPKAAISSFLKLSCGIADPVIKFDLDEYSEQIQDLSKLAKSIEDTEHCYSSHPFNPIRVMAVDLYGKSDQYQKLTSANDASASVSIDKVDEHIEQVLAYMEPLADNEKEKLYGTCLFWAGAWVAYSDGVFQQSESDNLKEQTSEEVYLEGIKLLEASSDPLALAQEQFHKSVTPLLSMPTADRCAFLQKLVAVARADQQIDDKEKDVLSEIAKAMKISPNFIQQILVFLD